MEYIFPSLLILVAVATAVLSFFSVVGLSNLSKGFGEKLIFVSVFFISILIAISVVLSGRDISRVGESINFLYGDDSAAGGLVVKYLTWSVAFVLLGYIFGLLLRSLFGHDVRGKRGGWAALL